MRRVQGREWLQLRRDYHLRMSWFEITSRGYIKAIVHSGGYKFYHYLNDAEKERFLASDYYKNSYRHAKSSKHPHVWYNEHYVSGNAENTLNWQEAQ